MAKNLPAMQETWLPSLGGEGKAWQPTPVFSPGGFYGQRSLVGYSPWGHKETGTTECPTLTFQNNPDDNETYGVESGGGVNYDINRRFG